MRHTVTLINGDGVGPEVVASACSVIAALEVDIDWDVCQAGSKVFEAGVGSGVTDQTVDSILKNKVVLKGPLETPIGYGAKSANVTLRKLFETYGNIRPARSLPGVLTPFSGRHIDLVIIRENVEDLYTGIEYMNTPEDALCLKMITRLGCEKIVRLAFEFATSQGRESITCVTKANIMKLTEGLLKNVFEEIAPEYPHITTQHMIVDNCAHQLVIAPEKFDVIVTSNLHGDILSDLCSGLVGGLGFAPSANLGDTTAIFEAVHGSAPTIAGKNVVNPTSILLSAAMMLRHLEEFEAASRMENAIYATLARGIVTKDVSGPYEKVSTTNFTQAVIHNLGAAFHDPGFERTYKALNMSRIKPKSRDVNTFNSNGLDVVITGMYDPATLGKDLEQLIEGSPFRLQTIANRGMQVYPLLKTCPDLVSTWQCRFMAPDMTQHDAAGLLDRLNQRYSWVQVQKLTTQNNKTAYSAIQGEN